MSPSTRAAALAKSSDAYLSASMSIVKASARTNVAMSGRDLSAAVGGLGCLMLLIPIMLILAGLFVAIAIGGGVVGVGSALALVGLVLVLVARARPARRPG